ncbi:hypothetical protein FVE85_2961 [Porphyridium purpureum]|uniref:Uncharacterized protein n=1 Tax=Porphyridium purpureum TaxID=35688 RepID=A0A5J4YUU1_PORPP|nr:hypothetical protein FVE85_2961 [Porphyridium purpureum]|eukprot:POR8583..scf227_4
MPQAGVTHGLDGRRSRRSLHELDAIAAVYVMALRVDALYHDQALSAVLLSMIGSLTFSPSSRPLASSTTDSSREKSAEANDESEESPEAQTLLSEAVRSRYSLADKQSNMPGEACFAAFVLIRASRILKWLPWRIRKSVTENAVFGALCPAALLRRLAEHHDQLSWPAQSGAGLGGADISDTWLLSDDENDGRFSSLKESYFRANLEKSWDAVLGLLRSFKGEIHAVAPGTLEPAAVRSLVAQLAPESITIFSTRLLNLLCRTCLPAEGEDLGDVLKNLSTRSSTEVDKLRFQKLEARFMDAGILASNSFSSSNPSSEVNHHAVTKRGGVNEKKNAYRPKYGRDATPPTKTGGAVTGAWTQIPAEAEKMFAETNLEMFFVRFLVAAESERIFACMRSLLFDALVRAVRAAKSWAQAPGQVSAFNVSRNIVRARLASRFLALCTYHANWCFGKQTRELCASALGKLRVREFNAMLSAAFQIPKEIDAATDEGSIFVTLSWLEPLVRMACTDVIAQETEWFRSALRSLVKLWESTLAPRLANDTLKAGEVAAIFLLSELFHELGMRIEPPHEFSALAPVQALTIDFWNGFVDFGPLMLPDVTSCHCHGQSGSDVGKSGSDGDTERRDPDDFAELLDDSRMERWLLPEAEELRRMMHARMHSKKKPNPKTARRIVPHVQSLSRSANGSVVSGRTGVEQTHLGIVSDGVADATRISLDPFVPSSFSSISTQASEDPRRKWIEKAIKQEMFAKQSPRLVELVNLAKQAAASVPQSKLGLSTRPEYGAKLVRESVSALLPDVREGVIEACASLVSRELSEASGMDPHLMQAPRRIGRVAPMDGQGDEGAAPDAEPEAITWQRRRSRVLPSSYSPGLAEQAAFLLNRLNVQHEGSHPTPAPHNDTFPDENSVEHGHTISPDSCAPNISMMSEVLPSQSQSQSQSPSPPLQQQLDKVVRQIEASGFTVVFGPPLFDDTTKPDPL